MNIRQVEVKGINLASFYPFIKHQIYLPNNQIPMAISSSNCGVKGVKMYIFIKKVKFLGRNDLENNLKLFCIHQNILGQVLSILSIQNNFGRVEFKGAHFRLYNGSSPYRCGRHPSVQFGAILSCFVVNTTLLLSMKSSNESKRPILSEKCLSR